MTVQQSLKSLPLYTQPEALLLGGRLIHLLQEASGHEFPKGSRDALRILQKIMLIKTQNAQTRQQ